MSNPNVATPTETEAVADLKKVHRATWAAGEYAAIATHIDEIPPAHLLAAVGVAPGARILDVATGTGNVAIQAAAAGARVTGLDLVPELLDVARARAAEADVELELVEGDAEALPFPDGSFDSVLSVFGVQFAPRHQRTADELVRVCRGGGSVGLVSWTPDGLIGRMFGVLGRYLPAPPAFASPPPRWGDRDHLTALLEQAAESADAVLEIEFERGINPWEFASVEHFMRFFEENYGPTLKARAKLTAQGTWDQCRADLIELFTALNSAEDGTARLDAEYLLTVARRIG